MTTIREAALREGIALELDKWRERIDAATDPDRRSCGSLAVAALRQLADDLENLAGERENAEELRVLLRAVGWARSVGPGIEAQWLEVASFLDVVAADLRAYDRATPEQGERE